MTRKEFWLKLFVQNDTALSSVLILCDRFVDAKQLSIGKEYIESRKKELYEKMPESEIKSVFPDYDPSRESRADDEIIKALHCCSGGERDCENCSRYDSDIPYCDEILMIDVLHLIYRRAVESERLVKENITLKYDLQVASEECLHAKSEAIKEFADRVKKEINFPLYVWNVFDNLVKEMVGE